MLNAGWKARWVAKGFKQIEGLHYGELHTAVAHKDTIRVFLSIVNRFDPEYDQVNIVSAFLNGELEETVYVHPPELSGIPKGKVLLLKKSLYGLKQSPRCFNKKLTLGSNRLVSGSLRQILACISDAREGILSSSRSTSMMP